VTPASTLSVCGTERGSGSITGVVTGPGGQPLERVQVTVETIYGDMIDTELTDAQGRYTVGNLATGSYMVKFEPRLISGFVPEVFDDKETAATFTPVQVTDGQATANINAALAAGSVMRGRVVGADNPGVGLAGVGVTIYNERGRIVDSAITDASGNYTSTFALRSGRYTVSFFAQVGSPYDGVFFNNKPTRETADRITVTAPNPVNDINATLPRPAAGRISGRVTAADGGAGLANVGVEISDSRNGRIWSRVETQADGSYQVDVPAGSYRVRFDPRFDSPYVENFYNSKADETAADLVTVTAGGTSANINGSLSRGAIISGRLTKAGGGNVTNAFVEVLNRAGRVVGRGFIATSDGSYSTDAVPPGNYRVFFDVNARGPDCNLVSQFHNNGAVVNVAGPTNITNINGTLAVGSNISGRITRGTSGEGLEDVWVDVFDAAGNQSVSLFFSAETGYYRTSGLATGAYRLRFRPPASSGLGPIFFNNKPTLASADPVQVTAPQARADVNIALQEVRQVFLPVVTR
jgi:hypothetical protein